MLRAVHYLAGASLGHSTIKHYLPGSVVEQCSFFLELSTANPGFRCYLWFTFSETLSWHRIMFLLLLNRCVLMFRIAVAPPCNNRWHVRFWNCRDIVSRSLPPPERLQSIWILLTSFRTNRWSWMQTYNTRKNTSNKCMERQIVFRFVFLLRRLRD